MMNRPLTVHLGIGEPKRTFRKLESAYEYALKKTLHAPQGTHTVVEDREWGVRIVMDRIEAGRVLVKFYRND